MSDVHAITMPKWGMEMTEGAVVKWLVQEGSEVSANDEIVEIETTKITNVYESPVSGTLHRIVIGEGKSVPVKTLLAVVAPADVSDDEIEAFIGKFATDSVPDDDEVADAPVSQTIETRAGGLHYVLSGEESGAPVLLLHGFGGDLNSWMFNQPVLSGRHTVYALDLPGHGASTKEVGTGDLSTLSGAVGAFIEALGLGKVHLVGHSLGGGCALLLALDRPEIVASLTLICPLGLGAEINMKYISGFIEASRRKEMKVVLEDLFIDPKSVSRDMVNDVLKFKRIDGVEQALTTIAQASFSGGVQSLSLRDRLAEIEVPVQVVWSADDAILPASQTADLPSSIPVQILEGAGHMVHMEKAARVNALIGELLADTA